MDINNKRVNIEIESIKVSIVKNPPESLENHKACNFLGEKIEALKVTTKKIPLTFGEKEKTKIRYFANVDNIASLYFGSKGKKGFLIQLEGFLNE